MVDAGSRSFTKMRILVLGGTGFIGANLLKHYADDERYIVNATYNKSTPLESLLPLSQWVQADLTNRADVAGLFENVDIVIQAAAVTSGAKDILERPYIHIADNAVMNSLIIPECVKSSVKHFIFFSCTVMYQSSIKPVKESDLNRNEQVFSSYFGAAHTKLYIERMLEFYSSTSAMMTTAIRHSNIYGPFDKYDLKKSHVFGATITKVMTAKDEVIVWGDGSQVRDFLHVNDLCCFVEKAIERQEVRNKVYNCGSGIGVSVKELVTKVVEVSGKKLSVSFDTSKPTLDFSLILDSTMASQELGWKPGVKLSDGIQQTIEWWKENVESL